MASHKMMQPSFIPDHPPRSQRMCADWHPFVRCKGKSNGLDQSGGFWRHQAWATSRQARGCEAPYENAASCGKQEAAEFRGAPGTIRTSDPQIRSLMLYPAELRARWRGVLRHLIWAWQPAISPFQCILAVPAPTAHPAAAWPDRSALTAQTSRSPLRQGTPACPPTICKCKVELHAADPGLPQN